VLFVGLQEESRLGTSKSSSAA